MRQEKVLAIKQSVQVHGSQYLSKGEYAVVCPFCRDRGQKDDGKKKLYVNPTNRAFYCFRCGAKGRGEFLWMQTPGTKKEKPVAPASMGPPPGFFNFNVLSMSLQPYIDYLKEREVFEQAAYVGAGACISGRFAGRVVIPMMDGNKVWTGFSARSIWPDAPLKYLYPTGMNRRESLWGLEWVERLRDPNSPIWLVEGVFDALPLFPQAVAAFGKNVTDEQIELLAKLNRPVIVCLDGDAWEEGQVLQKRLEIRGVPSDWCRLPPKTDPGKLGWKVHKYAQNRTFDSLVQPLA